jgi:hypothetical protein
VENKKKKDHRQPPECAFVLALLVDRPFVVEIHIRVPAGEEGSSSDCAFQILQRQYGMTPRSEMLNHEGDFKQKASA